MQDNNKKLNSTFFQLLRPLARLFLRFGRGYREYSELSKTAFISVASEDYGVHGRPTNVSRIAAMTGLTRKEISRIRGGLERGEGIVIERQTPVREVIEAWRTTDEFLDAAGEPAVLPFEGDRGSFRSLVKQYAGDIPEGAMKTELKRIGAAECAGGRFRLLPENPDKQAFEEAMASALRAGPYPLLTAMARNETVRREGDKWPLETVSRTTIRKSDVRRVRKLVSVRLRAATTNIADLLDAYATLQNGDATDEKLVPVSAGAFYAEGLDTKDC
ncbi:MAG: DUF6502 family protein [Woeseiaceae bacterium]